MNNIPTPQDVYLTRQQLEAIFQSVTATILGLDTNSGVRCAWQTQGAPSWKVTEDVAVVRAIEDDDPYNRQRTVQMTPLPLAGNPAAPDPLNVNQQTTYTRVIRCVWSIYGPNSFDNGQMVRDRLFDGDIRGTFAGSHLYFKTNIIAPARIPEYFQGQWWEREDFSVQFNELVVRNRTINAITNVAVTIGDQYGNTDSTVNIQGG
jgi:hypothetical protein